MRDMAICCPSRYKRMDTLSPEEKGSRERCKIAASVMGVNVKTLRILSVLCAAASAAAAVSFAGLIGFLGLIVPHGARLVVGDEIKKLFPLSVLWGSLLLLVCDTVARTAFAPFELSVGIVISIIGAPIFIRMLLKRKVG